MSLLCNLPEDVSREIWRNVYDECLTDITTTAKTVILNKRKKYFRDYKVLKEEYIDMKWKKWPHPWGEIFYNWEMMLEEMKNDDLQRYYKMEEYLEYMNDCTDMLCED